MGFNFNPKAIEEEFWVPAPVDHPTGRLLLGVLKLKGEDLSPGQYDKLWWMKVQDLAHEQFREWHKGKQTNPAAAVESVLNLLELRLFDLHEFSLDRFDKTMELVVSLLEMGGQAIELLSYVKEWLKNPSDRQAIETLQHCVPGDLEPVSQMEALEEYKGACFEDFLSVLSRI